jgi:hypothetical protein
MMKVKGSRRRYKDAKNIFQISEDLDDNSGNYDISGTPSKVKKGDGVYIKVTFSVLEYRSSKNLTCYAYGTAR